MLDLVKNCLVNLYHKQQVKNEDTQNVANIGVLT